MRALELKSLAAFNGAQVPLSELRALFPRPRSRAAAVQKKYGDVPPGDL